MVYTELTNKAMKLAYRAHHGQIDYNGIPYIFHPIHLAEQMKTEETVIVALLHDIIEDTDYKIEDLEKMGFPKSVTDAISLMTHKKSVPYMDYVAKIKQNPIAKAVKLADLRHNSDTSRLDVIDTKALKRVEKYKEAIEFLEN